MDWLLKHNLIKQYLQQNFKQREFKKAIKYTLIIGIQTLYQLHGNSATNPFDSFTLEQLSSMITSNNGTLQVQSDLPALNKCLKDIKTQLGNIQNELSEPQKSSKPKPIKPSTDNAQKFVRNLMGTNSTTNSNENTKEINTKSTSASSREAAPSNHEVVKKADHKWRDSDNAVFKPSAVYPKWWPDDANDNESDHDQENQTETKESNQHSFSENTQSRNIMEHSHHQPHVQQPHIYKQPVAFTVPTDQLKDEKVVQVHVNLYPEYLQKCLEPNSIQKVNNPEDIESEHGFTEQNSSSHCQVSHRGQRNTGNQTQNGTKKKSTRRHNRSKSLTRCTESSHAKLNGVRPQSAFLKSGRRDTAPCLKFQKLPKSSRPQSSRRRTRNNSMNERRKSLPNKTKVCGSNTVPKYLRNVQSRIKGELRKDRRRSQRVQSDKETVIRNIARYGLNDDENDADEWSHRFGYSRIGRDEITKPTAISVADAMMQSDLIKCFDPSFNKEPVLIGNTHKSSYGGDAEQERTRTEEPLTTTEESLYDRIRRSSHHKQSLASSGLDGMNMSFVTDLREWAAGLSTDYANTRSMDSDGTK